MIDPVIVIGDELNVVGFRLCGVAVRCPQPAEMMAEFDRALATACLVVLSRRAADAIGMERLRQARLRETPLVAVMPELAEPAADAGFERRLRAVLGIEA